MVIKWNRSAVKQLLDAIKFIEENGFFQYAVQLENDILLRIKQLSINPLIYSLDKYRRNNDGTYHAFEIDSYRVSYRIKTNEIRIVRKRHTSRRILRY